MTITNLVQSVTKKWAKQRKVEEREANARFRRHAALIRSDRETIKDVAWEIMEEAYMKASSGGTLPAHARQIMYAARGVIQARTQKPLDDQYFIQTLLVDYLTEYPEKAEEWDVVFDARGHFEEPHTACVVPLGTIDVRNYLQDLTDHEVSDPEPGITVPETHRFPTFGPEHRFGGILFIEKEGFMPLFREVKLAARYDLAIMSTKGMSVTASRLLIDELSAEGRSIPLFVLHDFDKSGFSILGTLERSTRRYEFKNDVEVIDLGLRLEDIKACQLESEDVCYGKSDPTWNLKENGATDKEVAFLCGEGERGKRVELNAFASRDLVEWIEGKLKRHGVTKVIPDDETLEAAYRRALEIALLKKEIEKIKAVIRGTAEDADIPRGLGKTIRGRLKLEPELPWDQVVADEVEQQLLNAKAPATNLRNKATPSQKRIRR